MTNKEKYIEFSKKNNSINFFAKPWWLNITAGSEKWDVCLIEKGGNIFAAMPYVIGNFLFFNGLEISMLSPRTQLFINYPKGQKTTKRYSFEKEVITKIIAQLPDLDYYNLKLNYELDNWLPFYWANFKQQTNYSYVIEDLSNLDLVFSNFGSNIKTDIKKAQKNVYVHSNYSIEKFYELNTLTFNRQGKKNPLTLDYLKKIHVETQKRNCSKMFFAEDNENNIHAVLFLVWDENSAYYMLSGGDPFLRNSGATSFLVWEAIKFVSDKTKSFDFEGSMIMPVEKFVKSFGGARKQFFKLQKYNSNLLRIFIGLSGMVDKSKF